MIQCLFFIVFNVSFHDIVYKVKVAGILPGELARCSGGLLFRQLMLILFDYMLSTIEYIASVFGALTYIFAFEEWGFQYLWDHMSVQ